MKHRFKTAALAALLSAMPLLSQAAIIQSNYTLVGGSTWLADFTVIHDGNPALITGFTIYFPENLFSSLSLVSAPSTWDSLVIPPDTALTAAGFLDSFVLLNADAIGAGGSQGGFRVQFDHLAGATPPALSFDINDPSFTVVFSGTTVVSVVPEPSSMLFASLGLCGLLAATRLPTRPRRASCIGGDSMKTPSWNRIRGILAATAIAGSLLVACGGGDDAAQQSSGSRAVALSADVRASAVAQQGVTLLTKVSETRVSRTVYDFVYTVKVQNGPVAMRNVQAKLTAVGAGSTIIDGDVVVGDLDEDAFATPADTITIRHDRAVAFNTAALAWAVTGTENIRGLSLVLTEYATFPQSFTTPALTDQRLNRIARINTVMEVPDGSERRAVPDLNGNLYFVKNGVPHVYLNVAATFAPKFFSGRGLGQGFGYVTFHPEFRTNGLFYTIHTESGAPLPVPDYAQPSSTFQGIITEWKATDPAADTFAGTRRELLRIGFGGQIHGIQEINFNPTARPGDADYGNLYLAVGEGGIGVSTTHPQNLAMPHGKLLRIDPRGTNSTNGKYGIPPSNPYVGQAGKLGEIYAYGFRDPHRFSWDKADGRMFLGHIGEHRIESIYEVRAGDNFGWSKREGRFVFDNTSSNPCLRIFPLPANDATLGYTYPVASYDHEPAANWNCTADVGVAIAGGFVYRGRTCPH